MIMPLWLLLLPYTTLAFAIHGGEIVQNVNRQLRNALCALPFGIVAWYIFSTHYDFPAGLFFFACAYIGSNMGFDSWLLDFKGFITFPPFGAWLLPLAYHNHLPAAKQEALSGLFYGTALAVIAILKACAVARGLI